MIADENSGEKTSQENAEFVEVEKISKRKGMKRKETKTKYSIELEEMNSPNGYDVVRPWKTLDDWQKKYIEEEKNCFLLTGRQVGKSTAMSIKAGEFAVHKLKRGENILMIALTERQAYSLFFKTLNYLEERYPDKILRGTNRPTKHEIKLKNGVMISCHPTGLTGEGIRGMTIKKMFVDEGARISEEVFDAVTPMLSIMGGTIDIASTPCGKGGYFYDCSLREDFVKFYVSAEDCPRHTKEFLAVERATKSKLVYAQEYLAQFLDELQRVFSDDLIKKCCVLKRPERISLLKKKYLGVDVGGLGEDESSFEILEKIDKDNIYQIENITTKRQYTTDTTNKVLQLESLYNFRKIGIDNGGLGVAVFHPLLRENKTKNKVVGLNNAQKEMDDTGKKRSSLLKEDMYMNLLNIMEQGKIRLLDDDNLIESLSSIQFEYEIDEHEKTKMRIYGSYSHIAEGLIRAAWLAVADKSLSLWCRSFNEK